MLQTTISDLPRLSSPATELAGARHEVEVPSGPNGAFVNKQATTEELQAVYNPPPNYRRGGPFFVIYLTKAEAVAAGRGDDDTLDQLNPELFCLGVTARVDLHPDGAGTVLTLTYDSRPAGSAGQVLAYLGGSFRFGRTIPAHWVATTTGGTTTTPLSQPTSFEATANGSQVDLSCDAVPYASGYRWQRATVTNNVVGSYSTLATTTTPAYSNTGVVAGTYSYRVIPVGSGAYSDGPASAAARVTVAASQAKGYQSTYTNTYPAAS